MKVKVFGLEFDGLPEELLNVAARETKDYMKPITPRGQTGRLKNSIGITKLSKYSRKVGASDQRKYPRMALLDLDWFIVRPKKSKVLKFFPGKGKGKKAVFAKYVRYPGGQHVISRTEEWVNSRLGDMADEVMAHYPKEGGI
ncbi:MAG: hypothetical protein ABFD18_06260 [Syntrophomonas sp.]